MEEIMRQRKAGVRERDPAYPLYLLKTWKRACAKEEMVELSVGTRGPLFSLSQGRELLTISPSASKLGRELTIKKKRWSSSELQTLTREVRRTSLQKEMRSPLPDPMKQDESSFQDTLGKRREFHSRELLYRLVSLHLNL